MNREEKEQRLTEKSMVFWFIIPKGMEVLLCRFLTLPSPLFIKSCLSDSLPWSTLALPTDTHTVGAYLSLSSCQQEVARNPDIPIMT